MIKEKGFTVAHTSKLCGVSQTTLRCIFKGKNVNESTVKAVCKALKLKADSTFKVSEDSKTALSSTTVHRYHGIISPMMNTAVEWQLIYSNPCSRLKPPKVEKNPDTLTKYRLQNCCSALKMKIYNLEKL